MMVVCLCKKKKTRKTQDGTQNPIANGSGVKMYSLPTPDSGLRTPDLFKYYNFKKEK
jgi:hypothetical protein